MDLGSEPNRSELENETILLQRELTQVRASAARSRELAACLQEEYDEINTRIEFARAEEKRNKEEGDHLEMEVSELADEVNAQLNELTRLMADAGQVTEGQSIVGRALSMVSVGDAMTVGGRSRASSCDSIADELESRFDMHMSGDESVCPDDLTDREILYGVDDKSVGSIDSRRHESRERLRHPSALQMQWEASMSARSTDTRTTAQSASKSKASSTKASRNREGFSPQDGGGEGYPKANESGESQRREKYRASPSKGSKRREYSEASNVASLASRSSHSSPSHKEGFKDSQANFSSLSSRTARSSPSHMKGSKDGRGSVASRSSRRSSRSSSSYTKGLKDGQGSAVSRSLRAARSRSSPAGGLQDSLVDYCVGDAKGHQEPRGSRSSVAEGEGGQIMVGDAADHSQSRNRSRAAEGDTIDRRGFFQQRQWLSSGSVSDSLSSSVFVFMKGLGEEVSLSER